MQRAIRILRIALPIAFFCFILLIVFSWKKTRTLRDGAASEPVVVTRTGEKPQLESKGFEDTQTIAGRVVSRIKAARVVAYQSSWNTLEGVELTIFRPNGLTYVLTCPQAQFNSQTKESDAKGGVKVTSSDGISIETAALHFDGNRLTNQIPVQFTIDQWHGNAGALDLNVEAETLRLFDRLKAASVPSTVAESPMTIDAADGTFRRKENDVQFSGSVVLTRAADRMTGDHMAGRFAQNRKTLVGLEGTGGITIFMSSNPSPGENLGGQKQITCDHFFSEVTPAGEISAINTVGAPGAPAHAVLDGPPKRDIVAGSFRIALVNKAVSQILAQPAVVMKELGQTPRQINSEHVTIDFDPKLHKASTAFLDGGVRYNDPRNKATAVRANYDITNDQVVLTAIPGFDPTVTSDGNILKAKQIEFSPKAGTAKATGSVIAQLVSKPGGSGSASADSTNVFPAGKPVFVNSDTLFMRQTNKVAIFSGSVRAWQDTNTIFAQELQVQGTGDSITARGNVRTILYNTSATASAAERKTPVVATSDQLVARKAERRIDLTGSVKIVDDQRTMSADHASFFFDGNKKIERMEAENKVVLVESGTNRRSTGDRAIYFVPDRLVRLFGKPATATAPNGSVSGDEIKIDLARNKVDVVSPSSPTKGSYKPQPTG